MFASSSLKQCCYSQTQSVLKRWSGECWRYGTGSLETTSRRYQWKFLLGSLFRTKGHLSLIVPGLLIWTRSGWQPLQKLSRNWDLPNVWYHLQDVQVINSLQAGYFNACFRISYPKTTRSRGLAERKGSVPKQWRCHTTGTSSPSRNISNNQTFKRRNQSTICQFSGQCSLVNMWIYDCVNMWRM